MKIRKIVRSTKDGNKVAAVNAVIASSVGEPGGTVGTRSTQHVEITQRNGHTEVREHHTDHSNDSHPNDSRPNDSHPNDKES